MEKEQNDIDARLRVKRAIDRVGDTVGMIRTILGRSPYKGYKGTNIYHLSVNDGFNIILEGITALKKEYGYLSSLFGEIRPLYPEANRKNIDVKIKATYAALEALDEYKAILSNIKTSLSELPVRFFD